jgi:hypothetical protein
MGRCLLWKICSCLLIITLAETAMLAEPAQAMLRPTGNVTVNGKPITTSTAVFAGDKIQTGPNSFASIESEGVWLALGPNSWATYGDNTVNVGCGSTSLTAAAGSKTVMNIGNVSVTPGPEFSKVEITQSQGKLIIKSTIGSATVTQGSETTSVNQGYMLDIPATVDCGPRAAAASDSKPTPGVKSNKLLPILLVAGGAGAAVGIALAVSGGEETVAPVTPAVP